MRLEANTDEELMTLYQSGDERAFQVLYQRHSAKVYGFICSRIRNEQKADDLFQEVFVKIHKSKHLYNQSLPVLPWIFTITKNTVVDEVRKSKKEKGQLQFDDVSYVPEISEPSLNLHEATPYLKSLSGNQRHAIELRYIDEKSFEEISTILRTSSVNVRQLISRGVQRMKELFQEGDKS